MSARWTEQPGWVGKPCECGDGYAPCQYDSNDECIACGRVWRAAAAGVDDAPDVAKTAFHAAPGSASELTLRACPFCGGGAELDTQQPYRNISTGRLESGIAVSCTRCDASMMTCRGDVPDIRPEEVVGEWNRRADERKTPNKQICD